MICDGAKNMSSVELTILDRAAHWRKVDARAPGRRLAGEFSGPQGSSSSASLTGGSSTVIALVSSCGRRPSVRLVILDGSVWSIKGSNALVGYEGPPEGVYAACFLVLLLLAQLLGRFLLGPQV